MAYTKTLAQIRTSVQVRGSYEGSADITAAVLLEVINDAIVDAYDVIVGRWQDYYTKVSANIPLVAGTDSYALPADFYKLRKVEIQMDSLGQQWKRLYPHDLSGANSYRQWTVVNKGYRYRLQGGQGGLPIVFVPMPAAPDNVRVWYIPQAPQLAIDTDAVTFDVPAEQRLVLQLALRDCLDRQDLDTSSADRKIEKLTTDLRTVADNRDAAEPFYLDERGPRETDEGEDWSAA